MKDYNPKEIETKWQAEWEKNGTYKASESSDKPKAYILDMFPYPSGEGLHVGHPKGYIATDVVSRMRRMQGFNVLHPMGWDAFGLPAENYAIKNKVHPRVAVEKNIERFKEQLSLIGLDYDWSREINTTDPKYYKWTQWIFLKLLEKGLAYESHEPVNWCPFDKTVLANEDVEKDGTCERCGTLVEKRPMRQWVLRITDYADRLLADLDTLSEWPNHIKEAQRNWIGRSEGAEINFELNFTRNPEANENRGPNGEKAAIKVFTTRPDTIYGATYLVLAPEHLWVTLATDDNHDVLENKEEVKKYLESVKSKSEVERTGNKEKSGVELKGVKAINPASGEEIPMWVGDHVLMGYGTGAIMAVPAHDERDLQFAKKYNLPVKVVVEKLMIDETEQSKPRPDLPFVERQAVDVLVKHWSEDKYLCLQWKQVDWRTFVTGGVEEGQTPEEAGRMEVREETGFVDLKFVGELGQYHSKFYHNPKKLNRFAHMHGLYFELQSDKQEDVVDEEKAKHDVHWVSRAEVESFIRDDSTSHLWRIFTGREKLLTEDGILTNSGQFNGLQSAEAREEIIKFVGGQKKTTYKLRDWVFSRQRYWGEPIPVVHCAACGVVPVPEAELPLTLPEVENYEPTGTGESPLANIEDWVNVKCPKCGGDARRETNTMPQWAGSSWYWLRFMDPHNESALVSKESEKMWGPVDVYVGGDHAVRHLIYARFWHKFLYDIGVVSTLEPFTRLEFLGFILAEDGRKMSKRWGNIVNPDDIIATFGADSFRTYEMFIGPFENTAPWSTNGVVGVRRFIERVWRIAGNVVEQPVDELEVPLNQLIKKVSEDIEAFKFNTAVSQMMIFVNKAEEVGKIGRSQFTAFLKLLAPFAPHVTEELWQSASGRMGHADSIHLQGWPTFDESKLTTDEVTISVQVNGKVRATLTVSTSSGEEEVKSQALALPEVQKWLGKTPPKKVIVVPGKVVSIVV